MKNALIVAVALSVAACGSAPNSSAATKQSASPSHPDESKYQIAGVHRMMKSGDVKTTLEKAGYKLDTNNQGLSWEARVHNARADASGKHDYDNSDVVPEYQNWKKGGEQIMVWYLPAPGDSVVKTIAYKAPGGMADPDAMKKTLIQRYGPPSIVDNRRVAWCSKPSMGCKSDQNYLGLTGTRIDVGGPAPDDVQLHEMVARAAREQGGAAQQSF